MITMANELSKRAEDTADTVRKPRGALSFHIFFILFPHCICIYIFMPACRWCEHERAPSTRA